MLGRFDLAELARFTGSEHWYRHAINRRVLFTDGAKWVADHAGAYWLLDEVALVQLHDKRVAAERFQIWTLKICADQSAKLMCEDGNGVPIRKKRIEFTDFPWDGITLWYTNNTILLPSEY